jgi:hypothetical protein
MPCVTTLSAVDNIAVSIKMGDIDKWIDIAKECKYLPENDLKVINRSYCILYYSCQYINCVQICISKLCNCVGRLTLRK